MDWLTATKATTAAAAWLRESWPWLLGVAAGVAAFYGAWWLWWRLPKRQADRLRNPVADRSAARTTCASMSGRAIVRQAAMERSVLCVQISAMQRFGALNRRLRARFARAE